MLLVLMALALQAPDTLRFPAPDRPVSRIIAADWSDEGDRDAAGEAPRVFAALGVRAGTRVADIGAGGGYYTVRAARAVGATGAVLAQDVMPEYLERLRARVRREGLANVQLVLGTPGDPSLPGAPADVAILSHMYHEIANPYELLWRLAPALAPGARVGIIDMDAPTDRHGTPPALLRCELAAVGYRFERIVDLAPADGYLAVFSPPLSRPAPAAIRPCRR